MIAPLEAGAIDPADAICSRPTAGAEVPNLPELRSRNGVLEVSLTFKAAVDAHGLARYCYVSDSGLQAPTLRVKPGDTLIIHLRNGAPANLSGTTAQHSRAAGSDPPCSDGPMSASSTNLHFHGMNIPPKCHQDDVLHTIVAAGNTFDYKIRIPDNEPPGLYWYHPHLHGFTQLQLQGGASGALIVEGTQRIQASLAGISERVFVIRDQPLSISGAQRQANAPSWDLSVNHVPIIYPQYETGTIRVRPAERQLWRVVNAAADTILDLQLTVRGKAQPLQVMAFDGVPVPGGPITQTNIPMPPGSRAEFVVITPEAGDTAQLITKPWDTGPAGDRDPQRPLASIVSQAGIAEHSLVAMPKRTMEAMDLSQNKISVTRKLYFAEAESEEHEGQAPDSAAADANTRFFVFAAGYQPAVFDPSAPPNIVVHQGTVEDWIVTNTTFEDHVFHIHQLHFQVMEINGRPVHDTEVRDTINVPHLSMTGPPPSVRLRMDFRGENLIGTFVYHCHLATHADGGMMGSIQVLPRGIASSITLSTPASKVGLKRTLTVTARIAGSAASGASPNGTVQFIVDGEVGPPVPIAGGQATTNVSFFRPSDHTIGAIYSGDSRYEASQAASIQVIAAAD